MLLVVALWSVRNRKWFLIAHFSTLMITAAAAYYVINPQIASEFLDFAISVMRLNEDAVSR